MGTYLITGVGRGIGHELARAILAQGHRVIGTVRDGAETSPKWDEVLATGRLELLTVDVRDEASVRAAAAQVDEPIDVLINNAGVYGPQRQSTDDTDFGGFLEALDVNTLGPLRVVQAFLPALRKARKSKVVTVSSRMGSLSEADSGSIAYRASKAAVNKVMQVLATDLAEDGITVASVHPGWVRTDMGGAEADLAPEESAAGLVSVIDKLGPDDSGQFFDYRGERLAF